MNEPGKVLEKFLSLNYERDSWHKILKISRNHLNNYLSGRRKPGYSFFNKLHSLGMDINLFFDNKVKIINLNHKETELLNNNIKEFSSLLIDAEIRARNVISDQNEIIQKINIIHQNISKI